MLITKRNKVVYEINSQRDYDQFLSKMYDKFKSSNNIIDIIPKMSEIDVITQTQMHKIIKKCIHESGTFPKRHSSASIDYWRLRGYNDINEINKLISQGQRFRSNLCVEYWLNRGYNLQEAKEKVKDIQSKNSKKSNEKRNPKYWLDRGYSEQEAKIESKRMSCRSIYYWLDRGYPEEEAKLKVKSIQGTLSLENQINAHGEVEGKRRYERINKNKSERMKGKNNYQFGKPAPKLSGNGISGYFGNDYFRSLYELSYLIHLNENDIQYINNDVSISKNKDKIIIPYIDENGMHRKYIPDFVVGKCIIEIKNSYTATLPNTKLKLEALDKYVKESNYFDDWKCIVDIDVDKTKIIEYYNLGSIVIDKNKQERFFGNIGI